MKFSTFAVLVSVVGLSTGCGGSLGGLFNSSESDETSEAGAPSARQRLENLNSVDCATLPGLVREARGDYFNDDNIREGNLDADKYGDVVNGLARCGESTMIFEELVALGSGSTRPFGVSVLLNAEHRSPGTVTDSFKAYAKANTGAAFLAKQGGVIAANHIAMWLVDSKQTDQCDTVGTAIEGGNERVRHAFDDFFIESGCKQAQALLIERLSDPDPEVRNVACARLALVGDASALPAVDAVAKGDKEFKISERPSDGNLARDEEGWLARKYYVAETCTLAGQSIRQRGK